MSAEGVTTGDRVRVQIWACGGNGRVVGTIEAVVTYAGAFEITARVEDGDEYLEVLTRSGCDDVADIAESMTWIGNADDVTLIERAA